METESTLLEQVDELIKKGQGVIATDHPNPPNVIGFPTLDSGAYAEWESQSLNFLTRLLGSKHVYVQNFNAKGDAGYTSAVKRGIGVLNAVREDLARGRLDNPKVVDIDAVIEQICSRFHLVAKQLRSRYQDRETLNVQDEYDVQNLLHAILWLYVEDVRPEEYTPSYAGKSSRMDFLLKRESIVIEAKKTRPGLDVKELSTQLIEDVERYKSHPDCKSLYCFVYDPEGFIANPRGVEHDLRRDGKPFSVRVLIRPL
jgi:DpnII restriction endonuclease